MRVRREGIDDRRAIFRGALLAEAAAFWQSTEGYEWRTSSLDGNAIVVGDPTQPGPYTIRVKVPAGVKLMPHKHPEDRVYTVISGVFYIGLGDRFDDEKLQAYAPGSVIVLPGNTPHFHWARSGEYVGQVTAIGPLGLEFMDSKDDRRNEP